MRSVAEIIHSHEVLDSTGIHIGGTDKHGPNHWYGDAYELLFASLGGRDSVKLIMEMGVADGACLQAWKEVFPNATIVGMDIHPSERAHGDRIEFHLGDQRSIADCERAAGGRLFDLIIDDATHLIEDTLRTLFYLWPSVRRGGVYVVEEFPAVGTIRNIIEMWPFAEIVPTAGPSGGIEPLVVFRKPL